MPTTNLISKTLGQTNIQSGNGIPDHVAPIATIYYDLDNTFFLPPLGYVFSVGEVIKDSKSIDVYLNMAYLICDKKDEYIIRKTV